jgi:hypothetical protein
VLRKRKTPLSALYPEREALRNNPLKPLNMETIPIITISALKLDRMVMIDNHSYQYKGQQTVRKNGGKKTVYLFKGVSTTADKQFNVTKAPTFKLVNDILKMN